MTANFDEQIGQNIRKLRIAANMSQAGFAESLPNPVSFQQIQKYENGSNRISAQMLYEMSGVLNCSLFSFFEGIMTDKNIKVHNDIKSIQDPIVRKAAEMLFEALANHLGKKKV